MVKGSGYITSQCCGSTEIELGTIYAAEMGISFFSDIDRYTLEDARVELAQSRAEIKAMPNGMEKLSIYTDNDIETYRNVLFYGRLFYADRSEA